MSSSETAAWAAAIATFLAVFVALLKEELVSIWRRPCLNVRIRLAPPDCHKTEFTLGNARTGEWLGTWPCYYLRIWVENAGSASADYVEVFARRLLRKDADDQFRDQPQFLPINFKWSHIGEVIPGLAAGSTVLSLDLQVATNTRSHLLAPGVYKLEVRVAAANSRPVDYTIQLTLKGTGSMTKPRCSRMGSVFVALTELAPPFWMVPRRASLSTSLPF
jgi:hypothetical protein